MKNKNVSSMEWLRINHPTHTINNVNGFYEIKLDGKIIAKAKLSSMAYYMAKINLTHE